MTLSVEHQLAIVTEKATTLLEANRALSLDLAREQEQTARLSAEVARLRGDIALALEYHGQRKYEITRFLLKSALTVDGINEPTARATTRCEIAPGAAGTQTRALPDGEVQL